MADLTYQLLAAQLPNGSLVDQGNGRLAINLNALLGEPTLALTDERIAETVSKLLAAAAAAQVAYNNANSVQINSYPNPTFGVPALNASGELVANRVHTVTVAIPLNLDEITANNL